MAMVNFKKGLLANLPAAKAEGTFYVTTDERALYLDVDGSTRVRIGDFQEFATLAALQANTNPSTTALYYVTELNCLAKWNGSKYAQINLDTGATSIEVVGDGNAVTAASYDAATRKLTLTAGATYATPTDVDSKITAKVGDVGEKTVKAYVDEKTTGIVSNEALTALGNRVTAAEGDIDTLQGDKTVDGSVAKKIDDAIKALDLANTYDAKGAADGKDAAIEAAKKAGDDAMTEAQKKVASVTGSGTVDVGTDAKNPVLAVKLHAAGADEAANMAVAKDDGIYVPTPAAAAEYSIVKDENSGEFAAIYHLTKAGVNTGAAINIPKDMVVQSGEVVEVSDTEAGTTGHPATAGTYIKLTLQNVTDPLFINVGDLIEYVTSGSAIGDMVVIAVSDDHKVTATITDGTITLAKLHADVQAEINKAHEHANKALLDTYTQTEANLADAVTKKHEHANKTELDKIADGDKAKWDTAATKAGTAVQSVASGSANGTISVDGDDVAVKGLDSAAYAKTTDFDASGAASTAETNAKSYADGLMTWGTF